MSDTAALRALRHLAAHYVRERRASGELSARLVSVSRERTRLLDAPTSDRGAHVERQIAELDRTRGTLEVTSRAADQNLRSLEALITAAAVAQRRQGGTPAVDEPVRGGWSSPRPWS